MKKSKKKKAPEYGWRIQRLVDLGFPRMQDILPESERDGGRVKITYLEMTEEAEKIDRISSLFSFGGMAQGYGDSSVPVGKYCSLIVGGEVMMSDSPYELESNREFLREAKGHVLVVGLGMGATLIPVARKPEVESVTVIEYDPDVIALVWPHMPEDVKAKTDLIQADFYEWKSEFSMLKFNTIWLDIWPDISCSHMPEMTKLRRRAAKMAAKGAWIGVWGRERARLQRKQEIATCWGSPPPLEDEDDTVGKARAREKMAERREAVKERRETRETLVKARKMLDSYPGESIRRELEALVDQIEGELANEGGSSDG